MSTIYLCPRCDIALDDQLTCPICMMKWKETIDVNSKGEMTRDQVEQLDFIDNTCNAFINEIGPMEWDAEKIARVRDAVIGIFTEDGKQTAYDIYPWLLEPEDDNGKAIPERNFELEGNENIYVNAELDDNTGEFPQPLRIKVLVNKHGVEIITKAVEAFDYCPVFIEQSDRKLVVYLWEGNDNEDPFFENRWEIKEETDG